METPEQLDLLATVHKIDKKLTKLFEIVTGDKDIGTDGMLVELNNLKKRIETVEKRSWIFIGILISIGVVFEIVRYSFNK